MDSYLYNFNEGANTWVNMGTSTTNSLDEQKGYMIYYPGSSTTYNFSGEMNNGTFITSVACTNPVTNGFNLVPNPYPSAINWRAATGWTRTNIDSAIYIWNSAVSTTAYASYASEVTTNGGSQFIAPGQAFFIHANASSPVLQMNNSVRIHNGIGFFKNEKQIPNVLKIKANSEEKTDEIAVRFTELATSEYDGSWDAFKFLGGNDGPILSTVASDNNKLSINSLPFTGSEVIVPMEFSTNVNSNVTFTASGIESFAENTPIYLEDVTLNKLVNLRTNPVYTFNYETSNPVDRFKLHFAGTIGMNDLTKVEGNAFISNGNLFIDVPAMNGQTADITIYNTIGQLIHAEKVTLDGIARIDAPQNTGVLVVHVSSSTNHFVTKVLNK
jgi:hypothetical protein